MVNLLNVPEGRRVHLVSANGRLRTRLIQYGLHIGDELRVLRSAPLGGPLLIEVNDRQIALGREAAERIFVEDECESP